MESHSVNPKFGQSGSYDFVHSNLTIFAGQFSSFSSLSDDDTLGKFNEFCLWQPVWPDWAIFRTLGKFLKPLATYNLPKSHTFLGNFCKGVKIYHFGAIFIDVWRPFTGHTGGHLPKIYLNCYCLLHIIDILKKLFEFTEVYLSIRLTRGCYIH